MAVKSKSTRGASWLLAPLFAMSGSLGAHAQPRIAVADPCFDYEVSGRVVDLHGNPASGVVVMRVQSRTDHAPYRPDLGAHFAPTTNTNGEFSIADRGLGFGAGRDWTLLISRQSCPDVVRAVHLEVGDGCGRYEAVGLVIRLPACAP